MRRFTGIGLLLAMIVGGGPARAEDVESRAKLASTQARLRGASSVMAVPWGIVSLGGSSLRQLATGSSEWQTLHSVPGHNLYRIAADDSGRLLAAWEGDPHFHLFVPKVKRHVTFPKPTAPSAEFWSFSLDALFFSDGGTDAIVFMRGPTGNSTLTTVAYRYRLEEGSEPTMLFRQAGHELHSSARVAVFAVPKSERNTCSDERCWPMAAILAYEISPKGATRKTLLTAAGDELSGANIVWGSDDERVAIVVQGRSNARFLLRWRNGDAKTDYRPLPKGPTSDLEDTRLTRSDDLVEVWTTNEGGLEIRRHSPQGDVTRSSLARFSHADPDVDYDLDVHALKERKNGDLLLHWGNYLVLLPAAGAPRALHIEPMLKRRNEWAGADIYVADPEALWIGIEVGRGRDFVRLSFAEIEKGAKPLP